MNNSQLSDFEITILREIKAFKMNEEWMAPREIELAFGDAVTYPGFCGKWGQSVIVDAKSPMLLLSPNKHVTIG